MKHLLLTAIALGSLALPVAGAKATDLVYMAYDPTIPQKEQLALRQNMGEDNLQDTMIAKNLEEKGQIDVAKDGSELDLIAPAAGNTGEDEYDHFMGHN